MPGLTVLQDRGNIVADAVDDARDIDADDDCSRVMSTLSDSTCLLMPDSRCATRSTASFSMSGSTTLAPASAIAMAMPRPMPDAAPVTMAVLPENTVAHDLQRRRGAIVAARMLEQPSGPSINKKSATVGGRYRLTFPDWVFQLLQLWFRVTISGR